MEGSWRAIESRVGTGYACITSAQSGLRLEPFALCKTRRPWSIDSKPERTAAYERPALRRSRSGSSLFLRGGVGEVDPEDVVEDGMPGPRRHGDRAGRCSLRLMSSEKFGASSLDVLTKESAEERQAGHELKDGWEGDLDGARELRGRRRRRGQHKAPSHGGGADAVRRDAG